MNINHQLYLHICPLDNNITVDQNNFALARTLFKQRACLPGLSLEGMNNRIVNHPIKVSIAHHKPLKKFLSWRRNTTRHWSFDYMANYDNTDSTGEGVAIPSEFPSSSVIVHDMSSRFKRSPKKSADAPLQATGHPSIQYCYGACTFWANLAKSHPM